MTDVMLSKGNRLRLAVFCNLPDRGIFILKEWANMIHILYYNRPVCNAMVVLPCSASPPIKLDL